MDRCRGKMEAADVKPVRDVVTYNLVQSAFYRESGQMLLA